MGGGGGRLFLFVCCFSHPCFSHPYFSHPWYRYPDLGSVLWRKEYLQSFVVADGEKEAEMEVEDVSSYSHSRPTQQMVGV